MNSSLQIQQFHWKNELIVVYIYTFGSWMKIMSSLILISFWTRNIHIEIFNKWNSAFFHVLSKRIRIKHAEAAYDLYDGSLQNFYLLERYNEIMMFNLRKSSNLIHPFILDTFKLLLFNFIIQIIILCELKFI